jgi:hypothetical protein
MVYTVNPHARHGKTRKFLGEYRSLASLLRSIRMTAEKRKISSSAFLLFKANRQVAVSLSFLRVSNEG